ncbi:MAG: hypothetical protein ACI4Q3_05470 [Kiritimatiellia bacterium]
MNPTSSDLLLLGVGGSGAAMTRGILRAFGPGIRALILDTDAKSGGSTGDVPFVLLGGNRLAGQGTGGQPTSARAAFQDDPTLLDAELEGVRTVVVVTALGGGTGGGATGELLKHLHALGIVTLLFATMPFSFEGAERQRNAKTAAGPIEQHADASVIMPLDDLVADARTDVMGEALQHAVDTMATGVTLLWRILERPGYIRLDAERLRNLLAGCGKARFATATAQGPRRTGDVLAALAAMPLLRRDESSPPVRSILVGILAGDDLRLAEIAEISGGLSAAFGEHATIELGTVNDETTFSGRLSVVVLLFEESATAGKRERDAAGRAQSAGERSLAGNSRFRHTDKSTWNGEDLDIPTYMRRNLTLDR